MIYSDRQSHCPYWLDPFSRTTKKNSITKTIKSAYVTMLGYLPLLNLLEKCPFSTASAKTERSRTINNSTDSAWAPFFRLLPPVSVDACGDELRAILDLLFVGSSAIAMFSNAFHPNSESAHGVPFSCSERKILKVDEDEGDRAIKDRRGGTIFASKCQARNIRPIT
jgi:hypothetical protein